METTFRLEGYHVEKLSFSARPRSTVGEFVLLVGSHSQPKTPVSPGRFGVMLSAGAKSKEGNPLAWRVDLTVASNEEEAVKGHYQFEIYIVGFFSLSSGYNHEDLRRIIGINAPSVLYSAAREIVANATGRGPYPALILPLYVFSGIESLEMPAVKKATKRKIPPRKKKPSRGT